MLVDTHCHINMMVKKQFDVSLELKDFDYAKQIIDEATAHEVTTIINVGTSLIESINCIELAKRFDNVVAAVGIHPNDCTADWRNDFKEITTLVENGQTNKIVGIGECGIDKYRPGYDLQRQHDAFKAHIELALEHDLALIVHSRTAYDETLRTLEEFKGQMKRGIIHCFSYDQMFADQVIAWNYVLGIGGVITYPKNDALRAIVFSVPLEKIVLETDAPFLPPQIIRGKQNHPKYIRTIAEYLAELRDVSYEEVARITTQTVNKVFNL